MKTHCISRIVWPSILAWLGAVLCVGVAACGDQVTLDAAMANGKVLADQKQTAYLRVAMTGIDLHGAGSRTPVNVAIVLDRSGSMQGEKIAKAKDAACMLVQRLRPDDIISVVAYDSTVNVVVPATRAANKAEILQQIGSLQPGASTALFAGVSKGANEVRKFMDRQHVNRIILLSDGLANVGPSSPGALAELGASLIREGIAVTTIGLGLDYNEDLMTALARKSDGNHVFAEQASDLASAFDREFGDVTTVVAQDVHATIRCGDGVRPIRVLGREADIVGLTVSLNLNQVYGGQMKYLVLEVELPAGRPGQGMKVADVDLSYSNMASKAVDRAQRTVLVGYSDSREAVEASQNVAVMASVVEQIGVENNRLAMRLRDEGKMEEGLRVLEDNVTYLHDNAVKLQSPRLMGGSKDNGSLVIQWYGGSARKGMQAWQHSTAYSQSTNIDGRETGRISHWGSPDK